MPGGSGRSFPCTAPATWKVVVELEGRSSWPAPPRSPAHRPPLHAAENIVIPQQQPVELLPREAAVIDLQAQLVAGLGLPFEVVGAPGSLRLRVLPPTWVAARGTTTGPASGARGAAAPGGDAQAAAAVAAAAAGLEGAKQKDYW